MTKQTLAWALDKLALRRRVVIASVVETSGSVPGKVGARLAVAESSDGFHGTIGGAGLELKVLNRCMEILENHFEPFGEVQTFGLNKSAKGYEVQPLDSLCGGRVTVSIELIIPPPHVLMMGGGHCANSLAKTINSLNWHHSVTDSRQEYCNADHHTLQQSKDRLHALLTSTMMGDVEYILDKSLEESKNKLTTLSNARDQLNNP